MRRRSEAVGARVNAVDETTEEKGEMGARSDPALSTSEMIGEPFPKSAGRRPIVESTHELAEALKPKPPAIFASANKGKGISDDFEALVEVVFRVADAKKEYDELEEALTVGERRGDHGTLRKCVDEAERNARRAHRLYLNARLEVEKWTLDADGVLATLREAASEALEEEKARGDRKKAITNTDVDAKMTERFPDEMKHQRLRRLKLKLMVDDMENLASRWGQRVHTLTVLLETLRK